VDQRANRDGGRNPQIHGRSDRGERSPVNSERVHWLVVIHLTFVVSGVLLAAMDSIASRVKAH
jgi:uncharacterized membrane protein YqhA